MYVVLSIKEEERMTQCRKQSEMRREERSDFVEGFESWFHTIPACISLGSKQFCLIRNPIFFYFCIFTNVKI